MLEILNFFAQDESRVLGLIVVIAVCFIGLACCIREFRRKE